MHWTETDLRFNNYPRIIYEQSCRIRYIALDLSTLRKGYIFIALIVPCGHWILLETGLYHLCAIVCNRQQKAWQTVWSESYSIYRLYFPKGNNRRHRSQLLVGCDGFARAVRTMNGNDKDLLLTTSLVGQCSLRGFVEYWINITYELYQDIKRQFELNIKVFLFTK